MAPAKPPTAPSTVLWGELGGQLVLAEGHSGKKSAGIAHKGRYQGEQDIVNPYLRDGVNADKGGEKEGYHDTEKKRASHLLQGHCIVAGQRLHKNQRYIAEDAQQNQFFI